MSSNDDANAQEPLPLRTLDAMPFWQGCQDGELLIQLCAACGRHQFYPRNLCATCGSREVAFVRASGRGTVFSFTVCHRPLAPRFAARTPYVVALVDLAEGPRMMTNIIDCPESELRIGMAVEVTFGPLGDDVTVPLFAPAGAGSA
jgi:uncharacterized protein